jgi:hypothetical protein
MYRPDNDPALATVPNRSDYPTAIDFCRAMQRWAAIEVDPRCDQRYLCIQDWFGEEVLLTQESSLHVPVE